MVSQYSDRLWRMCRDSTTVAHLLYTYGNHTTNDDIYLHRPTDPNRPPPAPPSPHQALALALTLSEPGQSTRATLLWNDLIHIRSRQNRIRIFFGSECQDCQGLIRTKLKENERKQTIREPEAQPWRHVKREGLVGTTIPYNVAGRAGPATKGAVAAIYPKS